MRRTPRITSLLIFVFIGHIQSNDIRERLAGRPLDGVNAIIGLTQELGPFMTPFTGSEQERLLLAEYLYTLTNPDSRLSGPDHKER